MLICEFIGMVHYFMLKIGSYNHLELFSSTISSLVHSTRITFPGIVAATILKHSQACFIISTNFKVTTLEKFLQAQLKVTTLEKFLQ
jgi:hypothetical protein